MKKRIMPLLLACAMVAALFAGCSAPAGETAADSIVIGGLAPLTGAVSVYGINVDNGVKIAVEEVNAAGGINGKQVKYICYDEKGDATEAVTAYKRLVESDGIVALIGDVTSTPCQAVAQESQNYGIPMITASGTAESLTATGPNVYRACFIDPFQGELMASYALNRLSAKTAAILYETGSDYSNGLKDSFVAMAGTLGLQVVAVEGYATGDVDFRSQLTKIAASSPDVLFLPEYYQDIALIAPQAREVGLASTLLGADGWDGLLGTIDPTNVATVEGCYFSAHASIESTDSAMAAFVSKYQEKYGETPNMFAALGYDAAMIMMKAIEKAGSTESAAIIEALNATDYSGITGHVTYDANRNPIKSASIMSIVASDDATGGEYKFVEVYDK